mmetsp:Transcript_36058/g.103716  ORF Transcript_36058/g.103716 Transcript_36058/m.103716 type:complete len:248 (+) Transcript_36058:98-841(+)
MPRASAPVGPFHFDDVASKFFVVAATSSSGSGTSDDIRNMGLLRFDAGDKIEVLQWSKCGWWWGQEVVARHSGWFSSAQVQPLVAVLPEDPQLPTPLSEQSVWPPLPPAPAPLCLTPAPTNPPVWPPLPPGPPPRTGTAPSSSAVSADTASGADGDAVRHAASEAYMQSLPFLWDGRVAKKEPTDRAITQLNHYFDYKAWVGTQNTTTIGTPSEFALAQSRRRGCSSSAPRHGRPTGDGGWKRARCC